MKVIIVEDEFLAQQELSWLIKEHSQMEIVGTFDDGLDVLKFLQHNRVDAIFLDINIPSLDGVLLAQNISQFAHKPFIVFITAWKEHAVEAFELEAFDYILKPYQESRITGMLQKLGRVWFASQPASLPVGSLCIDFPRLDIVLRGEYGNLLEAKQQRMVEGEMLFIPARAANLPVNNKPVMLLSLVFAPTWLGLSFYDSRTTSLLHPARQIQLPSLQRGEGEAMLTALTHLSRSPLEQNIIQPLVLSLLHLCRNVVNMPPGNSQPRGDFLYHSICNWVQDNYAQPLTRESVAQFFNITPNHLSKLFAQHGTMRFIEYVRWVRMAKARMILQKYHLSIHEVAQRCGFPDSDYFCRVFRRQFGLTPGEYSARFQG